MKKVFLIASFIIVQIFLTIPVQAAGIYIINNAYSDLIVSANIINHSKTKEIRIEKRVGRNSKMTWDNIDYWTWKVTGKVIVQGYQLDNEGGLTKVNCNRASSNENKYWMRITIDKKGKCTYFFRN